MASNYLENKAYRDAYSRKYFLKNRKEIYQRPRRIFMRYKWNAIVRGVSFKISFKTFMSFWQKPCVVGCKIETIGLDRIDSNKGYFVGNIRPMCRKHNIIKNKFSDKDIIEFAEVLKGMAS